MVSEPTVLVVGAGGSMPFGYPSGRQLVEQIVGGIRFILRGAQLEPSTPFAERLVEAGCDARQLRSFCAQLNQSQVYSVDAFLERYPEFSEVGKTTIATALLPKENLQDLFSQQDTWYRYLSNKLLDNISVGRTAPLTILTYNYDRSLECYLYNSLKAALHISDQEMAELISRLNVVHLHGSLGTLPWQSANADFPHRLYGHQNNVAEAARQIKIIHENVDDSPAYAVAREYLLGARRICFLGFGFHRTNVRRLMVGGWLGNDWLSGRILGTGLGLSDGERRHCLALLQDRLELQNSDCLEFLRHNLFMIS